ncbi:hypothetical protein [Aromatoleum bremense]|uniref:Uncharacterized protein n=1 Tax=Aromatoleum bremense TaxID=76115 RepID=A0ABX1NSQ2_9RHOO|nr:hypothetical protein [Aromatoleum bremense]NMG14645.1 hypothetical protein [Aromatoleum bremense]QTQ30509.1 Uncharacterized protein pbN1_05170 [Aromatoleum bremense]
MIGILKRITGRKHENDKRSLKENAEKILKHDQLIARVKSGTEVSAATAATLGRVQKSPPEEPVIDLESPVASTPEPDLPPGFEDELRRLSKLMDF